MANNNQNLRQLSNCLNQASSLINSFLAGGSDEQYTNPSVEWAQQLSQRQHAEHGWLESANTDDRIDSTERGSRHGQSEGLTTSTSQQTQNVSVVATAVNRARLMIQQLHQGVCIHV
jgi:hypothetical protein